MDRSTIRQVINFALVSALILAGNGKCRADEGSWQSSYDKAVGLHPKGDRGLKKKLLDEIRQHHCRLQIAFNVVLVAQTYAEHMDVAGSSRSVLAEVEPGSTSLLGKKVVRITPQANAQAMGLLDTATCDNKDVRVVASFFVRLLDTQRAELKLCPDRTFQALGGAPTTSEAASVTLAFRPVVSPDGKRIRFDFFDWPNTVHVFEPRSLVATMTWTYPGTDGVALGPPEFEFEEKATVFRNSVEVGEGDYILISRISATGEKEVEESVPILGHLPLLKRFLSKRHIEKQRAQVIFLLRPVFDRYPR
ncbi:MAG: type II and III secretion system protein [Planctomycetes bacterium]|nr:type II and III secretion system protein [Planctomycetota bacterium]